MIILIIIYCIIIYKFYNYNTDQNHFLKEKKRKKVQEIVMFTHFHYSIPLSKISLCSKKRALLNHELSLLYCNQLYHCVFCIYTYSICLFFHYTILKFGDPKMNESHQITQFDLILKQQHFDIENRANKPEQRQ